MAIKRKRGAENMPPAKKPDINFILRRVFGKEAFRPLQAEVIDATVAGHDVFLCAATSFGKSLCYQLPAVASTGVTIVISPLLALMTNQVAAAQKLGVKTESITGSTTRSDRTRIENDLLCGHPETRLLYVTPELCATKRFQDIMIKIHRQGQLTRVAIDEAHCVSEWGHDFRPAYKDLTWLKQKLNLPSVPIMAVTATATFKVRQDIFKFLGLDEATTKSFSTSTARPNIHYDVRYFSESSPQHESGDDMYAFLVTWLKKIHKRRIAAIQADGPAVFRQRISGIIYVPLRTSADQLAAKLTQLKISATAYHAGLQPTQRIAIQLQFLNPTLAPEIETCDITSSFNIICATTAFGMGIDMPTVRFVIHYGLPRGLESFVQESGRAGRDDKAAASLVLYTREDRDRSIYRVTQDIHRDKTHNKTQSTAKIESLRKTIEFCENVTKCRHGLIADYFGDVCDAGDEGNSKEKGKGKGWCDYACDVCNQPTRVVERKRLGLATDEAAFEFTQREPTASYDWE